MWSADQGGTPPPPEPPQVLDPLLTLYDTDSAELTKALQAHVIAAVDDPVKRRNLLTYNFDAQVIPFLDLLPENSSPLSWLPSLIDDGDLYRGELFDDMPVRDEDVFDHNYDYYAPDSGIPSAFETLSTLPCGWSNKAILSFSHGLVNNVKSPQACQHLCQAVINPIKWNECPVNEKTGVLNWLKSFLAPFTSTEEEENTGTGVLEHQCDGISYIPQSHTCVLHERIYGVFPASGIYSAPSLCKGGAIALPHEMYVKAQDHSDCLNTTFNRIRYLTDNVMHSFSSKAAWSYREYSPQLRANEQELAEWESHFLTYTLIEPLLLLNEVTVVNSLMSCQALCYVDEKCYIYNWISLGENQQLCYKTMNTGLKALTIPRVDPWLKSSSGKRVDIPTSILSQISDADLAEAKAHVDHNVPAPLVNDCVFYGYVGLNDVIDQSKVFEYNVWKSYVNSFHLTQPVDSYTACKESCERMLDCRGWSFAYSACDLFSAEFPAVLPVTDTSRVIGFNRLGSDLLGGSFVSLCWDKADASGMLAVYKSNVTTATSLNRSLARRNRRTRERVLLEDSTVQCIEDFGVRLPQVSLHGHLISGTDESEPNVLTAESTQDCQNACVNNEECIAWTFGTWNGCYLYDQVERLIADPSTISGFPYCEEFTFKDSDIPVPSAPIRPLDSCVNARLHTAFTKGNLLKENIDTYPDERTCWNACRTTKNCFHSVYVTLNMTMSNCIFFEDVDFESATLYRPAIYMPSSCDSTGMPRYGIPGNNGVGGHALGLIVGLTLAGVLLAAAIGWFYRQRLLAQAQTVKEPVVLREADDSANSMGAEEENPQESPRF